MTITGPEVQPARQRWLLSMDCGVAPNELLISSMKLKSVFNKGISCNKIYMIQSIYCQNVLRRCSPKTKWQVFPSFSQKYNWDHFFFRKQHQANFTSGKLCSLWCTKSSLLFKDQFCFYVKMWSYDFLKSFFIFDQTIIQVYVQSAFRKQELHCSWLTGNAERFFSIPSIFAFRWIYYTWIYVGVVQIPEFLNVP